ncbi:MAG: hypothetical protein ACO289_02130 [Prochlorococcaceae cyanobacterium]
MNFTTLLALPLLLPTLTPTLTPTLAPVLTAQQAVTFPAELVCPVAPNGLRYYGPAC